MTRLTDAMLVVIGDALNEHEAGGWIALTQNLDGGEDGDAARAYVENAEKAQRWVAEERARREAKAKTKAWRFADGRRP